MINAGKGLSLPPVKGNKLAVFSRSGGHAIVSVDVANELDLSFQTSRVN
jgi:acyl-CoA synthetase (NDP forming)